MEELFEEGGKTTLRRRVGSAIGLVAIIAGLGYGGARLIIEGVERFVPDAIELESDSVTPPSVMTDQDKIKEIVSKSQAGDTKVDTVGKVYARTKEMTPGTTSRRSIRDFILVSIEARRYLVGREQLSGNLAEWLYKPNDIEFCTDNPSIPPEPQKIYLGRDINTGGFKANVGALLNTLPSNVNCYPGWTLDDVLQKQLPPTTTTSTTAATTTTTLPPAQPISRRQLATTTTRLAETTTSIHSRRINQSTTSTTVTSSRSTITLPT